MKRAFVSPLTLLAIIAVSGCAEPDWGTRIDTLDAARKIKMGMTFEDVKEITGAPSPEFDRSRRMPGGSEPLATYWTFWDVENRNQDLSVKFFNGVVKTVEVTDGDDQEIFKAVF